jgi:hypothetical protein
VNAIAKAPRLRVVAYDPVSEKLASVAPIADHRILEAFTKYDALTLAELQLERAACEERFRAWAREPANAQRPIADAPDHMDRIALDSLLERRLFTE